MTRMLNHETADEAEEPEKLVRDPQPCRALSRRGAGVADRVRTEDLGA